MCAGTATDVSVNENEDGIPTAEELEAYYKMLETCTVLELDWQCPGRRPLSPDCFSNSSKEPINSIGISETPEHSKSNDFDFSDDIAQPQMRVRNQNSTPKSAKKKTANFAGVMEVLKKKNAEVSN